MDTMTIHEPAVSEPNTLTEEQRVTQLVLDQLGRPRNLLRINAKKLWDNHYRVNVYCVVDASGPVQVVNMTDSFFVTMADDAITSRPAIPRRYQVN